MLTAKISGIHELLNENVVRVQLPGSSKAEVLEGLFQLIGTHPRVEDFEEVRTAVLKREAVMSTGVGKGLALPHAKTASVNGIVAAFATTAEPIDYGAIDNMPVQLLFLMLSTENAKTQHIKLLSRVSRLMNEDAFRVRLLEAQHAVDVLTIFKEGEERLS